MSKSQQIANIEFAAQEWKKVRPEDVAPGLKFWHCGTQACFGGWLVHLPYFQKQGVVPANTLSMPDFMGRESAPTIVPPNGEHLQPFEVSAKLFGSDFLFSSRGGREVDLDILDEDPYISDHELVLRRLTAAYARLISPEIRNDE
jgi:hypothetical protein